MKSVGMCYGVKCLNILALLAMRLGVGNCFFTVAVRWGSSYRHGGIRCLHDQLTLSEELASKTQSCLGALMPATTGLASNH